MTMQSLFSPLTVINKRTFLMLALVEGVLALLVWQLTAGELIPTPTRVLAAIGTILGRLAPRFTASSAHNINAALAETQMVR